MAIDSDQAIKAPTVLFTGASSQIGVFAVPRLIEAGFQVMAVSRRGRPEWCPDTDGVKWVSVYEAMSTAHLHDYLISAGPMELTTSLLEKGSKLQSVLVFSSSSVESKQQSGNLQERNQMREMSDLESGLLNMAKQKGLRLTIFRPTLIYGCGLDANISRLAEWIRRFGFVPINGRGKGLRQPVHAEDLAEAALAAIQCQQYLPPIMSLAGGETLSYSTMVARIFKALGRSPRLIRLPQWLFVTVSRVASILPLGRGINSEMVRRQNIDLLFEDGDARDLLKFEPRSFHPTTADFRVLDICLDEDSTPGD